MFCSGSAISPAVPVGGCGFWRSVTGVDVPGWPAPVFTSDPLPKAWMAFSGRQNEEFRAQRRRPLLPLGEDGEDGEDVRWVILKSL